MKKNKIEDFHDLIPHNTYEWLTARTGLPYRVIHEYCKKNNLKTKRKTNKKFLQEETLKRLKKIRNIDTSKKTQKQLAKILQLKTRQACSQFIRKHKIEYKRSKKDTITEKRLCELKKIDKDILKQTDIWDIAEILGFDGKYAKENTHRFLRQYNIEYK